jgi:hypothetical protein
MSAIECGIRTNDWHAVAEGQAMLESLQHDVAHYQKELKSVAVGGGGCVSYMTNLYRVYYELRDWKYVSGNNDIGYDPTQEVTPYWYARPIREVDDDTDN